MKCVALVYTVYTPVDTRTQCLDLQSAPVSYLAGPDILNTHVHVPQLMIKGKEWSESLFISAGQWKRSLYASDLC